MPMTIEAMQAAVDNPATGSIRRRYLRRALAGIRAVGPSAPPVPAAEQPQTLKAGQKTLEKKAMSEHARTVAAELRAVEEHARTLAERIENVSSASRASSSALEEWRAEYRNMVELRQMLEADLSAGPIMQDRHGRDLTERDRACIRRRAAELRDSNWQQAEIADRHGDRHHARFCRRDALRARMLAESEARWRPEQPGYGISQWN